MEPFNFENAGLRALLNAIQNGSAIDGRSSEVGDGWRSIKKELGFPSNLPVNDAAIYKHNANTSKHNASTSKHDVSTSKHDITASKYDAEIPHRCDFSDSTVISAGAMSPGRCLEFGVPETQERASDSQAPKSSRSESFPHGFTVEAVNPGEALCVVSSSTDRVNTNHVLSSSPEWLLAPTHARTRMVHFTRNTAQRGRLSSSPSLESERSSASQSPAARESMQLCLVDIDNVVSGLNPPAGFLRAHLVHYLKSLLVDVPKHRVTMLQWSHASGKRHQQHTSLNLRDGHVVVAFMGSSDEVDNWTRILHLGVVLYAQAHF